MEGLIDTYNEMRRGGVYTLVVLDVRHLSYIISKGPVDRLRFGGGSRVSSHNNKIHIRLAYELRGYCFHASEVVLISILANLCNKGRLLSLTTN